MGVNTRGLQVEGQGQLRGKRYKVHTKTHVVLDQRDRTTRRVTIVYPDHLGILYVQSSAYRRQYERDEDVEKKRETMFCFSPISTPVRLHESHPGLYCKERIYAYCGT
jgi:hypothetical protein